MKLKQYPSQPTLTFRYVPCLQSHFISSTACGIGSLMTPCSTTYKDRTGCPHEDVQTLTLPPRPNNNQDVYQVLSRNRTHHRVISGISHP